MAVNVNQKKIFITGIAGFIGFHLALFLHKKGDLVIGCDNFDPYYDVELKRQRERILLESGIPVIECDICSSQLDQHIKDHQTTHLVNLAAQAGVRYSITNPQAYVKNNLYGFTNILEICRRNPGIKLTYASSSSVYGANKKIPFSEEDPTDYPMSFYGATKKNNEVMAHSYHNLYGISVTGLRFFTVYGPWGRPDMAYFSFAKKIAESSPIEIFNKGDMKRDFTYIDDIVKGIAAAIDFEAKCEIFNLGKGQPENLLELVSCIEKEMGKKAYKKPLPMQQGDIEETYADIQKARHLLGFNPSVSLSEGIQRFIDWYLNYHLSC